jgi:hypothetical protein
MPNNFYEAGISGGRKAAEDDIGLFDDIFTPWGLRSQIVNLLTRVSAFSRDVEDSTVSDIYKLKFKAWAKEFADWTVRNSNLIALSLNETRDQLRGYQSTFSAFMEDFKKAGGEIKTPAAVQRPDESKPEKERGSSTLKWIIGGAVIIAGVWGIVKIASR